MRKPVAASLTIAALALSAGPLAGTSNAQAIPPILDGCTADLLREGHPGPNVVWVDPYGRIVIDPNGANATVSSVRASVVTYVNCVL